MGRSFRSSGWTDSPVHGIPPGTSSHTGIELLEQQERGHSLYIRTSSPARPPEGHGQASWEGTDKTESTKNRAVGTCESTAHGEVLRKPHATSPMTKQGKTVINSEDKYEGAEARARSCNTSHIASVLNESRAGTVVMTDLLREIVWMEAGTEDIDGRAESYWETGRMQVVVEF